MILKNKYGYYIIVGLGNMIYLPSDIESIVEFIDDYFSQLK